VWNSALRVTVVLVVMASSPLAQGVCQVALPERASYCEHDDLGACCLIESAPGCSDIVCYDFDACAWRQEGRLCV